MAWYDEAIFYHIYPLGMTGAPFENSYGEPVHRLNEIKAWIPRLKELGFTALYIGPLFESVGHGYETTDYKKLDSRLGTNEDLTAFVAYCHDNGIRVILDGVFNHTGRDFFAFKDIKEKRESSGYKDWYCNVNFWGNNEYNDGFSYDNWGGYNLLVKLNQRNPAVIGYICDVIRFWVKEFDIDGIRLDTADVLDFSFMQALRGVANEVKPEFWLMGEVIHGEYSRWVNEGTLHSVTNYHLHKALFSGHNDHNYFEIAHTVKRQLDMGGRLKLYNFVDNHDVERIYTKLNNKAHYYPTHILLYTLPGVPSVYYGSEYGIEGRKERGSDASLRPVMKYEDYKDAMETNQYAPFIGALGRIRKALPALSYGDYKEISLTTRQYAFSRNLDGQSVIITVNNDDNEAWFNLPASSQAYTDALSGREALVTDGRLNVSIPANGGAIWVPAGTDLDVPDSPVIPAYKSATNPVPGTSQVFTQTQTPQSDHTPETAKRSEMSVTISKSGNIDSNNKNTDLSSGRENISEADTEDWRSETYIVPSIPYEQMTIDQLHGVILSKMRSNGPVTDQMLRDIENNTHQPSLVGWAKSFR